jgi:CheY-like chemotaxis protein
MNQESFRLLVVDDEDTARCSLADILRLEGYLVETASGGESAIQMISKYDFDLILLDLKMPGVDGLEVLRHLASIETASS